MHRPLVIIPTYNELENINLMIDQVMAYETGYHLLIVDDGSPDGTGNAVKKKQEQYPDRLFLIERSGKLGLGTAYLTGFKWSIDKGYTHSFEMDCDFSHNPDDLDRLFVEIKNGADLVIGSRYVKGGGVEDWPKSRLFLSYFASIYVRAILWMPVRDTTAGFKCYSNVALQSIDLDTEPFKGYAFQIFMKYRLWKRGFKVKEIPILFKDRERGVSKMSSGIIGEAITAVIKMRFNRV